MTEFGFTRSFRSEQVQYGKTFHITEDDIPKERSEIKADTDDCLVPEYGNHFGSVFKEGNAVQALVDEATVKIVDVVVVGNMHF